ncbi:tetratricopeptide repeat protein [Streptomyces sp. NPDC020794]|uniref:tetratricopeptide repeat protein n=1 Tax=Streptomyces sp. NPDC020794 TaxID=3365090 RepID=UPI0037A4DFC9
MKRRKLWAGLAGTAAVVTGVAAGVTVWATQSESASPPESKAASVTSKPQDANALLHTALQQQQSQDLRGADRTYRRVLELDPHNKLAWYSLGVIAQQYGKMDDARAAYDKALKIDPSFVSALFSEAFLLKSSDPDRAVELLKRASAADPKAATIHMQLGLLLAEKGRADEAEDAFRRAVAAAPSLLPQVPERFRDSVSPSPTASQTGNTG